MPDKKYGKPARPFEIWNIGNYETVYWQEKQDEYLAFMLKQADVFGWEWSYDVNELAKELAQKNGVETCSKYHLIHSLQRIWHRSPQPQTSPQHRQR